MRDRYVLLLAAVVFFANTEVNSVAADATPSTSTLEHLLTAEKDDVSVPSYLRTAATAPEADEERESITKFVKKLVSFFKAKTVEQKLPKWKAQYVPLKDVREAETVQEKLDTLLDDTLLDDTHFKLWLNYMQDFVGETYVKATVATFVDVDGVKNLDNVLSVKTGEPDDLATKLYSELVQKWLPAENNQALKRMLQKIWQPVLWSAFKDELLSVLRARLGDKALAKKLETMIADPETKERAGRLQLKQLKSWVKRREGPASAFDFLGLKRSANLLDKPNLKVWLKYVDYLLRLKSIHSLPKIMNFFMYFDNKRLPKKLTELVTKAGPDKAAEESRTKLINLLVETQVLPTNIPLILGATPDEQFMTAYHTAAEMNPWIPRRSSPK